MRPSEALSFKRPLRAHQKQALDRFAYESEAALFWEMGTGKTTAAIALLRAKYNLAKAVTPTLIVTPVATLYNWLEEFKINAPERVVDSVLVPYMKTRKTKYTGKERAELIRTSGKPIVIINGEALDDDSVLQAIKELAPVNCVVDELHKFKSYKLFSGNPKLRRPSRPARLRQITNEVKNCIGLTGTPILNSYLDLWSQFYILDKGVTFGTNFYTFRETYFHDKNIGWRGQANYFQNWQPKRGIEALITAKIAEKSSRLEKSECMELPPLVYETHHVELGADQLKAYLSLEKEMLAELEGGVVAVNNALSRLTRLLQMISGHVPVEHEGRSAKVLTYFKSNPRMIALQDLIEELTPKHKVIIWAGYQANYPQIRQMLTVLNLQWAEVVGQTKNRQEELDRFRDDPKCRVMLSNPQAGGVGVNMVAASYAIYYSRSYSLGDRLQSEARNHRGGSEEHPKITIIDLVARGTLDEAVLSSLLRKEDFSDQILDRLKALR